MADLVLSVAIITYKQEDFISQTLDSILSQEHKFPYEIVIGEDCSPDGTKAVIEKYAAKYPDIIKPIYNNPNLGLIKNYFNVISHCSGKYIMECAGDDYWLPGKVQSQIAYMEAHPEVGMCYGQAKNYDETTHAMTDSIVGVKCEAYEQIFLGNSIPALTVCFRNDLIKKYMADVNPVEKNWRMEDLPEWLWFSKESKIVFLEQQFGVYRMQSESESHFVDEERKKLYEDSCLEIRRFYAEKYNTAELLQAYTCHWGFIEAWQNKDRLALIKYGEGLGQSDRNLKNKLKIFFAKREKIFNKLFK